MTFHLLKCLARAVAKHGVKFVCQLIPGSEALYDIAADAKNRISLRGAKAKYFHVKALSNGCYVLEPRVLVAPEAVPARTLKMLERCWSAWIPRPLQTHSTKLSLRTNTKY